MVRCFWCGTDNEQGNHCARCGAALPKVDPNIVVGAGTPRSRDKYEALRGEVTKVRQGQISWFDFAHWFQPFYDDIAERMASLVESIAQSHGEGWTYYEEFTEEVETTFSGLEDYELGLNLMWDAIDQQNLPGAESAVAIFLRGAEKLNDALAINAQSRAASTDLGGYL